MARPSLRSPRIVLAYAAAVLAVTATACKDAPPAQSDDTGTSSGGPLPGSSSSGLDPSATGTPPPPPPETTAEPDSTTFGDGCGADPCPEKCGDCPSTGTCLASVWTCECDCAATGTTGDGPCDVLAAELDAWVEAGESPAVDCGSPGPADAMFAWQTLHDCSTIQAMGSGLRAGWTLGDDADPFEFGIGGRVGEVYELAWFERSSAGLVQYSCTAITSTPDCTVDVGSPCLTCEGQTEVAVICEEAGGSTSATSSSG